MTYLSCFIIKIRCKSKWTVVTNIGEQNVGRIFIKCYYSSGPSNKNFVVLIGPQPC